MGSCVQLFQVFCLPRRLFSELYCLSSSKKKSNERNEGNNNLDPGTRGRVKQQNHRRRSEGGPGGFNPYFFCGGYTAPTFVE